MLVPDFADDGLHQILDGGEAVDASEFVDHQRQMRAGRAHLDEKIDHRHRRGNEEDFAHQTGKVGRLPVLGQSPVIEEIADMDHADRVVEGLAVDRQPGVSGPAHDLDDLGERRLLLDGNDVGMGHHDIVDRELAKAQEIGQHRALGIGELRLAAVVSLEKFLDGLPQGVAVAAADQAAQPAGKA